MNKNQFLYSLKKQTILHIITINSLKKTHKIKQYINSPTNVILKIKDICLYGVKSDLLGQNKTKKKRTMNVYNTKTTKIFTFT